MPIRSQTRALSLLLATIVFLLASQKVASAPPVPKPLLYLIGVEAFDQGEKRLIRYRYDVSNKYLYWPEMFAPAPSLPPCGENASASRTWVDLYDQGGNRLNGFCALTKPGDLSQIWFALDQDAIPPSWVYIEIYDRQTNTRYKSNLADTVQ